jgi:hypothetical protein
MVADVHDHLTLNGALRLATDHNRVRRPARWRDTRRARPLARDQAEPNSARDVWPRFELSAAGSEGKDHVGANDHSENDSNEGGAPHQVPLHDARTPALRRVARHDAEGRRHQGGEHHVSAHDQQCRVGHAVSMRGDLPDRFGRLVDIEGSPSSAGLVETGG